MVQTAGKVKSLAEDLNLSESKVSAVLYGYLTYCLQEALLDGESKTIFGILKLDESHRLVLENDITGLISLINRSDLKLIRKIAEDGPAASIFGILDETRKV
jgi:hypothetical protein